MSASERRHEIRAAVWSKLTKSEQHELTPLVNKGLSGGKQPIAAVVESNEEGC